MYLAILSGLIAGSFLTMLVYRITNKISLFDPWFSFCPQCGQRIKIFDLIPIISYLLLGGQCRFCKKKIDISYFLIEIIIVLLAIVLFKFYGFNQNFFIEGLLYMLLIGAAFSDIKTGEIEYLFTLGSLLIVLILKGLTINALLIASTVFLVFLTIAFIGQKIYRQEVFGGADILLLTVGAYYFNFNLLFIFLYIPFVVGSIWGIFLLLVKKQKIMRFAPFIVGSFLVTNFLMLMN